MDAKIRAIVSKAAGTYFIVTDNSAVAEIEEDSRLRLFFINSKKGPVNVLCKFAKGNTTGFTTMFGKGTRLEEKKGNFSTRVCLDALTTGPIAVINLRAFDDTLDLTTALGMNPNIDKNSINNALPYTKLFNTNKFWTAYPKGMPDLFTNDSLLTFGNVGNNDLSIFVTFATDTDVEGLTSQGDYTLANSTLEIDEYPALNTEMLLKRTFVNVYVFNNTFNEDSISTNKYYGQYFDEDGNVDIDNIDSLCDVTEAGFVKKFTGSLIPHLVSETDENISIDNVINAYYTTYGLIAYINDDLFEAENTFLLDIDGYKFFNGTTAKVTGTSDYLMSYVVPDTLTTASVTYPPTTVVENAAPAEANLITYQCAKVSEIAFEGSFDQGIIVGDKIRGIDGELVTVDSITVLDSATVIGSTTSTYNKVQYNCSGNILFTQVGTTTVYTIIKENTFIDNGTIHPFDMSAYKVRAAQFTDGTSSRQSEILDMMNTTGIFKGIVGTEGIRYVVDCFKSFVESSYKYQYGLLMYNLDQSNRFVRAIINEPFVEDLQKSTNPLFKDASGGTFSWEYLKTGGNTTYSSKLLTKFTTGASFCFFFGPGNIVNYVTRPLSGLISNLFYSKTNQYDVVANSTGYVDNVEELETAIDDEDRAYCEAFRYNPIIYLSSGYTIYGNNTGQKLNTAQLQIHNSELLAYIKIQLYGLAKTESFKKATYNDYLRTQTECENFMESLVTAGAVESDGLVVKCDTENNTTELKKYKIKLVHIEYTPVNALEKVVFDLTIN